MGLEPKGLTISVINTGYINTPMTQQRPFEMPFIVEADDAAGRIIHGLKKQRYEIAFPLSLVAVLKLGRILTNIAYFRFARRFLIDRKPRSDWTGHTDRTGKACCHRRARKDNQLLTINSLLTIVDIA